MNIKELAIQGLLQKHGKAHLYETCPELINELVELGGELGSTQKHYLGPITTTPHIPHDFWNRQLRDFPNPMVVTCDNGVTDYD